MYDPARNDLFFASRGRGAFLNDRRLRVSKRINLSDALVGTGFPFRRGDDFERYLQMMQSVMQRCAGVRRPGAAALDLCYVAAGWYDGFFETGLNPWDVAAGSLMITEAGGLIGNFTGESHFLHQREVVAGNPKIYGQLVHLLAPFTRRQGRRGRAAEATWPRRWRARRCRDARASLPHRRQRALRSTCSAPQSRGGCARAQWVTTGSEGVTNASARCDVVPCANAAASLECAQAEPGTRNTRCDEPAPFGQQQQERS